DAFNAVVSTAGSADQLDITAVHFDLSTDRQTLITTITLKNFSTVPATGTLGGIYRVIWTAAARNADGGLATTIYATEAKTDPTGAVTYRYGVYDPVAPGLVGPVTATGSATTGPNGTLKVNVPLSFLGNPTIPITDANALPPVIEPYAVAFASEQAVYFS